ncbi:MAG: hypothetical protein LUG84_01785 [Akkermansiaceae bacterium]|nr:hypothetical protein [Akkermansiaceae bacterium]
MESYIWKEKSRGDGDVMLYRASYHGSRWKLERCPKVPRSRRDEVGWEPVAFSEEHWRTLRELLWRRYQRKKCPWEFIENIDKILNPAES